MAYNKKTDYWKWKADCLISSFQRRHKKVGKKYTFISKRSDYAEIIKDKMTRCEYCDTKLNKNNFTVDHGIPLSRGGDTSEDNLVYCCNKCNQAKAEMTDSEFKELMTLIKTWDDEGKYILSKLRSASLVFRGRRRF